MKNLRWFDKVLFVVNSLFAIALLLAYLLPYLPPQTFALVSVLSLTVPLLIIINVVFLVYWLLRLKRLVLLPFFVLLLGFNHITSIYEFSAPGDNEEYKGGISILSYNVRQFNQFKWSEEIDIPQKISAFIEAQNPDILSMQEYYKGELDIALKFPYKYIEQKEKSAEFGLAIFSKFPIVNSGSLDFPTPSNNNSIYVDVVIGTDTVRVVNVHLQSFSLKPKLSLEIEKEESKRVFKGMGQTFVRQQEQVEMVLDVVDEVSYKTIIMGDFNNTAYSYIYRDLKSRGFEDAFKEEGNGFGRTFDFDYFPLRIDYIFPEEGIETVAFTTFEVPYSDHFPVKAILKLNPAKKAE